MNKPFQLIRQADDQFSGVADRPAKKDIAEVGSQFCRNPVDALCVFIKLGDEGERSGRIMA